MAIKVQDDRKPGWFWADNDLIRVYGKRIGMNGIAVYCTLLTYAQRETDGSGNCFPSISTLAKAIGSSEPTIRKALEKLEKVGLITISQRLSQEPGIPNQSNSYHILAIGDMHPGKNSLPPTDENLPSTPKVGQNSLPPLVKKIPHPGKNSLDEQEPVNKNQLNKNKREADEPPPAPEIKFVEDFYRVRFPKNKPPGRNWIVEHTEQFGQKAVLVGIARAKARDKPAPHYISAIISTLSPDELARYDDYGILIPVSTKVTNISRPRAEPAATRQWSEFTQRVAGKPTG